jgi:5-methyltetrahydropteroyltriglutamate--homocysteine methyltransferase
MVLATNLGYPRIGPYRELKKFVEAFWAGKLTAKELQEECGILRRKNW